MIMYKMVQTGAKTQLGGLKKGFSNVKNQVVTEDCVAKLDSAPTSTQTEMATMDFVKLAFFKIKKLKLGGANK